MLLLRGGLRLLLVYVLESGERQEVSPIHLAQQLLGRVRIFVVVVVRVSLTFVVSFLHIAFVARLGLRVGQLGVAQSLLDLTSLLGLEAWTSQTFLSHVKHTFQCAQLFAGLVAVERVTEAAGHELGLVNARRLNTLLRSARAGASTAARPLGTFGRFLFLELAIMLYFAAVALSILYPMFKVVFKAFLIISRDSVQVAQMTVDLHLGVVFGQQVALSCQEHVREDREQAPQVKDGLNARFNREAIHDLHAQVSLLLDALQHLIGHFSVGSVKLAVVQGVHQVQLYVCGRALTIFAALSCLVRDECDPVVCHTDEQHKYSVLTPLVELRYLIIELDNLSARRLELAETHQDRLPKQLGVVFNAPVTKLLEIVVEKEQVAKHIALQGLGFPLQVSPLLLTQVILVVYLEDVTARLQIEKLEACAVFQAAERITDVNPSLLYSGFNEAHGVVQAVEATQHASILLFHLYLANLRELACVNGVAEGLGTDQVAQLARLLPIELGLFNVHESLF